MKSQGRMTVVVGMSVGGAPACYLIENHISRFVEGQVGVQAPSSSMFYHIYVYLELARTPCLPYGCLVQDPRDVELIWDQMFRATLNYGRKGLPL